MFQGKKFPYMLLISIIMVQLTPLLLLLLPPATSTNMDGENHFIFLVVSKEKHLKHH
jgi:hypothetical protein